MAATCDGVGDSVGPSVTSFPWGGHGLCLPADPSPGELRIVSGWQRILHTPNARTSTQLLRDEEQDLKEVSFHPNEPMRAQPRGAQAVAVPPLRLVGTLPAPAGAEDAPVTSEKSGEVPAGAHSVAHPGTHPGTHAGVVNPCDPRWILALRTAQELEGEILPQEKREHLLSAGTAMGLSPFDANLIIAIVHDQARQGWRSEQCAAASAERLARVSLPKSTCGRWGGIRHVLVSSLIVGAVLGLEVLIMYLLFF
jgi:hypothetical protein